MKICATSKKLRMLINNNKKLIWHKLLSPQIKKNK